MKQKLRYCVRLLHGREQRFLGFVVLALIALPARAQVSENVDKCWGDDPNLIIAGCTALMQSSDMPPDILAKIYLSRGNAFFKKHLYDQAIADYTMAITIKPSYTYAYENRGKAFYHKHLYDQAIADQTKAIALDPDSARPYYDRGIIYQLKGQRDKAISDYRASLKIDPNSKVARELLKSLGAEP